MLKFSEFLQEDNGGQSCARLNAFMVTSAAVFDWVWNTIHGEQWNPSITVAGILIAAWGAKVVQKRFEEKPGSDDGGITPP